MKRTIHIRDDVHSKLRLEAFDKNRSLQGLVNEILQKHITEKYDTGY